MLDAHLGQRLYFPAEIVTTNLRLDLMLWSQWSEAVWEAFECRKLRNVELAADAQQWG